MIIVGNILMSYSRKVNKLIKESCQKHGTSRCFWCECELVKYPLEKGETLPHNYATIDHLYSKLHPLRKTYPTGERRLVLSCHKCNDERNELEIERIISYGQNNNS